MNDGGPAFPIYHQPGPEMSFQIAQCGMTLRDYFAAAALTGLLSNGENVLFNDVAREAYAAADAMLDQR